MKSENNIIIVENYFGKLALDVITGKLTKDGPIAMYIYDDSVYSFHDIKNLIARTADIDASTLLRALAMKYPHHPRMIESSARYSNTSTSIWSPNMVAVPEQQRPQDDSPMTDQTSYRTNYKEKFVVALVDAGLYKVISESSLRYDAKRDILECSETGFKLFDFSRYRYTDLISDKIIRGEIPYNVYRYIERLIDIGVIAGRDAFNLEQTLDKCNAINNIVSEAIEHSDQKFNQDVSHLLGMTTFISIGNHEPFNILKMVYEIDTESFDLEIVPHIYYKEIKYMRKRLLELKHGINISK